MGGGLMQLVAYGAQDIYLTGNPQITFFKVVYRRHTNFSMETIQQTINGSSQAPISGTTSGTVTISRNGDLVHKVYVRGVGSSAGNWSDGNDLISEVELEIGGQRIDKQTSEWMKVWNELTTPDSKAKGLKSMTGAIGYWGDSDNSGPPNNGVNYCQIPLQFWFCRNPGLALPLIALQYHEVKLKFTWGAMTQLTDCSVWADYIYLDTDERRRFAQVSHEYLIEQLQIQSGSLSSSHKLNFNHPVKELIWTETTVTQTYDNKTKLQLNGHDRFAEQVQEYFMLRQPYDYHTAVPHCNIPRSGYSEHHGKEYAWVPGVTVSTGTGDSPNIGEWLQPADTVIIGMWLHCDVAAAHGSGDVGYEVGTTSSGAQIVAAVTDGIGDGTTTIAAGLNLPLTLVAPTDDGTDSIQGTLVDRTIYFNITNTVAATTAGSFSFIVEYLNVPHGANHQYGHSRARTSKFKGLINCYSFALKPEEHQPSGTCNFSRIDNAKLMFTGGTNPTIANIYAVNYNVLRIMSGMGGLAYSN